MPSTWHGSIILVGPFVERPAASTVSQIFIATDTDRVYFDDGESWTTVWSSTLANLAGIVNVRDYGATGDGSTDDATSIQDAIDSLVTSGGIVFFPTGNYIVTAGLVVHEHVTIRGSGRLETFITTANAINVITLAGPQITIEDITIRKTGIVAGVGIVTSNRYFFTTRKIDVLGFQDGLNGELTLYHHHKESRFESGAFGVRYFGSAGTWNVDWFNNVLTFENCRFNGNSDTGCEIKGHNLLFSNCDASNCTVYGFHIIGESAAEQARGVVFLCPYTELSTIPFLFDFTVATIIGGFSQGGAAGTPFTSVIEVNQNSDVVIDSFTTIDFWTNRYNVTNTSRLEIRRLWQGANGSNTVDATSEAYDLDYEEGSWTGTLTGCTTSPTTSIDFVRHGNMVTLNIPGVTATSNTTGASITGMPASLRPAQDVSMPIRGIDNGVWAWRLANINTAGTIALHPTAEGGTAWTASGTKGVATTTISYNLNS